MGVSAIALLGAPGAGKGTIAAGLKARIPCVHLSTGDLLRDAVRDKSAMGTSAEAYMKRGDLVPDNIILSMVMDRIDHGEGSARYMFDGFPRTRSQAELLHAGFEERGAALERVFLLVVPEPVVLDRLGGRRICRKCGANFHVRNIPPRQEGICDYCGGELYQRPDDAERTIMKRLDVFRKQSDGLFSFYEEQGILVRIDSSGIWQDVVAGILGQLNQSAGHDYNQE